MPRSALSPLACASLAATLAAGPAAAGAPSAAPPSPYFLMGRAESVQWRPWGEEAFLEARQTGRPVLLDVGAMWCHYCQLMSATTYRDPGVAEMVNEHFVPIKVDRDEHPEVDQRFQAAMLEIRRMGGWPLTAFLTEEGRIFAGATYLPPGEDKDGRPGLRMVAERYGTNFQDQKRGYNNAAEEIANRFIQAEDGAHRSGRLEGFADAIARNMAETGDGAHGGFGTGAKFPETPAFGFALERGARGDAELLKLARLTLDRMADGGIRDLLGGGFHRAAVDRMWKVPRFEKLIAVNAGLVELYANGWRWTRVERYRRLANETLDYVLTTLCDPAGGFYAAQGADLDGSDNGSTYTVTLEEVRAKLSGDALKMATAYFDLLEEPAVVSGRPKANVLAALDSVETAAFEAGLEPERAVRALGEAIEGLRKLRRARPSPPVDLSLYSSFNGLAAHALLVAAPVLGRDDARARALAALDRFLEQAWDPKTGFARGLREGRRIGEGLLQDQVYMAQALLDAYETTHDMKWWKAAVAAIDLTFQRFENKAAGRLLDLPAVSGPRFSALVIPSHPVQDTLVPGENALAALLLARLERLGGDESRLDRARKLAGAFAGSGRGYGPNAATLARAAERILDPPPRVLVIAPAGDPLGQKLVDAALAGERPVAVLRFPGKDAVPEPLRAGALGLALEKGTVPFAAVGGEAAASGPFAGVEELSAALRLPPSPPPPAATPEPTK